MGSQASEVKPTGSKIRAQINVNPDVFRDPLTSEIFKDVPYEITDFAIPSPPKNDPESS